MKRSGLERGDLPGQDGDVALESHLLLVADQAGRILTVQEAPGLAEAERARLEGGKLTDVFGDVEAKQLTRAIARAIRARAMQSEHVETDGVVHEFLCIPQGRDRALLVLRDISDSRQKLDRVEALAYRDEATGLPNRQSFLAELGRVLDWQRLQEGRLAVILIDFERMDAGSSPRFEDREAAVLKELASRLVLQLRGVNDTAEDDVERYSVVARTDRQQFGIILPSIEAGEDAVSVSKRLVATLRAPVKNEFETVVLDASAGIALYPQDGAEPQELCDNAQAAVQDARFGDEATYRFHTGTVRLRALQRQDIAADLRSALDRGEFALNYQPIVDAASAELSVVEALLRWPSEIFGTRTTQKIITTAEYTGLITAIGEWVFSTGLSQLRAWRDETGRDIRLAVNLSTREFAQAGLAEKIEQALAETGIEAGGLDIEIRENVLFRDALQGFETSRSLAGLGVGLVVDDLGTGSSSIAHLAESPLTGLKIDGTFVAGIESSDADRATCAAVIAIAKSLGRPVTAEGVETAEQAEFLRSLGCDCLQGFLTAAPLTAEDLLDYLRALPAQPDEVRAS